MAGGWWVISQPGSGRTTIWEPDRSGAAAAGTVISGPYATHAQAQAAINSTPRAPSSGPGPNGRYSYAQLEGLWINAGGSASMAPLMAAIAEAESGGNPNATGGVGEKGLWQINPAAWGSLATYDPAGNARAAVHVLAVQGLGAWSTYTSGAYRAFINGSTTPDTNVASGGGSSGSGGSSGATLTGNTSRCLVGGGSVFPCLLDASQARALIGGLMILAGGLVAIPGLVVLLVSVGGPAAAVGKAIPLTRVAGMPLPAIRRDSGTLPDLEPAGPSPQAPAASTSSSPAAPAGGQKVRVGGSQVSQDWLDRYGAPS